MKNKKFLLLAIAALMLASLACNAIVPATTPVPVFAPKATETPLVTATAEPTVPPTATLEPFVIGEPTEAGVTGVLEDVDGSHPAPAGFAWLVVVAPVLSGDPNAAFESWQGNDDIPVILDGDGNVISVETWVYITDEGRGMVFAFTVPVDASIKGLAMSVPGQEIFPLEGLFEKNNPPAGLNG